MTFAGLSPAELASLFVVAGGALVLLRIRRPPRRALPFVFVALARRALDRRALGAERSRVVRVAALVLSLAALALLVAAAGDPRPSARVAGGAANGPNLSSTARSPARSPARSIVLLVDTSASMGGLDEAGEGGAPITRLEAARARLRSIVERMGDEDRAAIVRLDDAPAPLGGLVSDRSALLDRLDALRPGDGRADLVAGLRVARALVDDAPSAILVLASDGAFAPDALAHVHRRAGVERDGRGVALDGVDLRWVAVGTSGDDLAITLLAARRDPAHAADCLVLVEIASTRSTAADVALEIAVDDGAAAGGRPASPSPSLARSGGGSSDRADRRSVVRLEPFHVPAGGRVRRLLEAIPAAGTRLTARLVGPAPGALDPFPFDDQAFAVLAPSRRRRVLLAGEEDLFVEGALLADESIALSEVRPAAWDEAVAARADVVVLDGFTPPRPPPVPALYLDPSGPHSPIAIRGRLRAPSVTEVAPHPLTRFLALADLNVEVARRFVPGPLDRALVSSGDAPLYVAREERGRPRVAALAFDPRRSDLPLRVAFPLLVQHAIDWLGGAPSEPVARVARVGEPIALAAEPGGTIRVEGPGGQRQAIADGDGVARFVPERAGFYLARSGEPAATALAVGAPSDEGVAPARELRVDGTPLEPPERGADPVAPPPPPFRALVLCALALLVAEGLLLAFARQP